MILRRVEWYYFTDVSGQRIGPILKDQEIQNRAFLLDFLTLEDGTDTLFRNVSKGLPLGGFFLDFLTLGDGTDKLSRNVGKGLLLDAA